MLSNTDVDLSHEGGSVLEASVKELCSLCATSAFSWSSPLHSLLVFELFPSVRQRVRFASASFSRYVLVRVTRKWELYLSAAASLHVSMGDASLKTSIGAVSMYG